MKWGSPSVFTTGLVPIGVSRLARTRDTGRDKTGGGEVKRSPTHPLIPFDQNHAVAPTEIVFCDLELGTKGVISPSPFTCPAKYMSLAAWSCRYSTRSDT